MDTSLSGNHPHTLSDGAGLSAVRAGRSAPATIMGNRLGSGIEYSHRGGQARVTLPADGVGARGDHR
jgi:hypothetical protein